MQNSINKKFLITIVVAAILMTAGELYAKHHETTIVIVNLTGSDIILTEHKTTGDWKEKPQGLITNGGAMKCRVTSDKLLSGHEVWLKYSVKDLGGVVSFYIENSFGSGNHAKEQNEGVPPIQDPNDPSKNKPLYFNRYGPPDHGDNIACTWVLSWENLQKDGQIPKSEINDYMKKAKDELNSYQK